MKAWPASDNPSPHAAPRRSGLPSPAGTAALDPTPAIDHLIGRYLAL